jgi:hypothetical protein
MTCHRESAAAGDVILSEAKNLLFFARRDEVGAL